MFAGYLAGELYGREFNSPRRKRILFQSGWTAIIIFIILRLSNGYGDASHWRLQPHLLFSLFSFLNVTKYPPSLLYILITVGPGLIFLALTENVSNWLTRQVEVFGRVPMFFYLAHILLIHVLATIGAAMLGFKISAMVLTTSVQAAPALKGYGFNLPVVYGVWGLLLLLLYPCCKWFDLFKRNHQSTKWWLRYL